MRLAISNIAWNELEDNEIYGFLKKMNIVDLEIAPTRMIKENPYDNIELARIKADDLLLKYSLSIKSMQSIWYGKTENIFESEDSYFKLLEYTKKSIDFANAINCTNIVFGCPKNRNMFDYKRDYLKAVDFFRQVGEYASDRDVVIAVEPNPTIYNTNFLNTTIEAIEFVKDVNMKNVKINYDLGTVIENNESINVIKDNLHLINHIHISEPNLDVINHKTLIRDLFFLLKKEKYDKLVSIEMRRSDINIFKEVVVSILKLMEDTYGV